MCVGKIALLRPKDAMCAGKIAFFRLNTTICIVRIALSGPGDAIYGARIGFSGQETRFTVGGEARAAGLGQVRMSVKMGSSSSPRKPHGEPPGHHRVPVKHRVRLKEGLHDPFVDLGGKLGGVECRFFGIPGVL